MADLEFLISERFCLERKFSPKSKQSYIRSISSFEEHIGKSYLEAHPADAKKYIDDLLNSDEKKTSTVKRTYHQLLSFYNYLLDHHMVKVNPFHTVAVPHVPRFLAADRVPSFEEMEKFFQVGKTVLTPREYALLFFIATTGLKLNEVLTLKWTNFFIDGEGQVAVKLGSQSHPRYVLVLEAAWNLINSYRENFLEVSDEVLSQEVLVFVRQRDLENYRDNPYSVEKIIGDAYLRSQIHKCCEEAGIGLFTAKDLRHAHAVFVAKYGASVGEITEQLNWSSKQLMKRYDGLFARMTVAANTYAKDYYEGLVGGIKRG